jgi:CubicO group peptidase (beta-lactamase class C family)
MKIAHLLASCAIAAVLIQPSSANAAGDGRAWPQLETLVDSKIESVREANKIPGMTIAVTKNGRLVLSKGYGYMLLPGNKASPMKPDLRTRIGSVSKAVVTGPSAFKMMKQKGIDPKTKKLYGKGGVFGNKYDSDMQVGIDRYTPILGMAISPKDKIYTWYANGTVSTGSSNDLDRDEKPVPFKLPPNRLLTDIRAIGISGSDSKVYVWYNDGALSIGGSRDLGLYRKVEWDKDGNLKQKVKLPSGKSMLNVVGIDIAKSNDHVYIWYDDGTVSSGTSLDFTYYFTGKTYSVPPGSGQTRYNIRDIGIAANDHVYAWFGNGQASSGTSTTLDQYIEPYAYSLPPQGRSGGPDDRERWFDDITLQHLLDHRAGFQRDGDQDGAMTMFKVSESALTYEQVHRHFLRTRPLRWAPDKGSSYSNHGFGLWTLIFEALTGDTYRNYAINKHLKPMGLNGPVRPQTANNDSKDSIAHELANGKIKSLPFKDSGLGLAAGGWTASATSLVKIMDKLDGAYTEKELMDMGWGRETRGKLHHNGLTGGGTAYVVMFPAGYKSVDGSDLSDVHIAIAANIATDAQALENLASQIALAVPKASISGNYDIWKGKPVN